MNVRSRWQGKQSLARYARVEISVAVGKIQPLRAYWRSKDILSDLFCLFCFQSELKLSVEF